ncbi:XylR N-terminal domain-containing protein [Aliibacillus thermotolerans]|uniref:XylR N-terminal domain-containing protein n=1 Tax=Aliibacillus thermotolerans TaxID=1834418 RepID=A0ABW0U498_9BACI|nr:XylR N-terminal domain-containing protein [Aliibacillus thermotolerans]MDA3129903.1 PucR family transcriptional regulator [Aliibacillus thermotolerans]
MDKSLPQHRHTTFTEDGLIYMEGSRTILIPTSSVGILRKELYENIGMNRVKGFLIRYGAHLGREDAKIIKKKFKNETTVTKIEKGPVYHQLRGHTKATITRMKVKNYQDKISLYLEGTWEDSYEGFEYVEQFGIADAPVCHTLVGYANGYLTEICNQKVVFKEISCVGIGDKICKWVCRTVDYLTDEMSEELKFFKEEPIVKELELTYEKLLEERNHLKNVSTINNKLTEEILKGKDLPAIMNLVYELTDTAILVESAEFKPIASGGLSQNEWKEINESFKEYIHCQKLKRKPFYQTEIISLENHTRLTSPVYLQGELNGYCSFICDLEDKEPHLLQMIIERISTICSLYLLNKRTELEAEERVKGRFLEQMIHGEYTKEEIVRRSHFVGVDLFQDYYMVVVCIETLFDSYKKDLTFLEEVMNETSLYFQKQGKSILTGQQGNHLVMLLLKQEVEEEGIQKVCEHYLETFSKKYPSVSFRAGISMSSDEIEKASESYQEALTSVRMTSKTNNLMTFESLGILGPLINSNNKKEVERMALYTLRPLGEKLEDHKNLELIKTLYSYLLNGGNLERTASDLSLSLSGLRYRIGKIEKVMEQDIKHPEVSYKLLLSIQALISIGTLDLEKY